MKLERRHVELSEVRMKEKDDKKKAIVGYAAVFNSPSEMLYGSFREAIVPGAFVQSLMENDIRALFDHNSGYVLGRNKAGTLSLTEDERGLRVEIDPPDTQWAQDLMVSVERGDISQMSFGFNVRTEEWQRQADGTELRILKNIDLQEVSIVAFPAYQQTSVNVRNLSDEALELAELLTKPTETLDAEQKERLKRSIERASIAFQHKKTVSADILRKKLLISNL